MRRKKAKSRALPAESIPLELATLIERDVGADSLTFEPIVHTVTAEEASRHRALVSPTGADIEAVRQGDRAVSLEHLADRLSRGWVEATGGGDPAILPPWEVLTPQPWKLTGQQSEILKRLAAQAKITPDAMKREILKCAVIAAIHDDDRPVWRSLQGAIFGDCSPEDADQLFGRLKPGEINEWDIYVQWFHRRALALADAFVDEEYETESTRVEKVPFEGRTHVVSLGSPESHHSEVLELPELVDQPRGALHRGKAPTRNIRTLSMADGHRTFGSRVMHSLVAVLVGEGPGSMKPVLTSEAPRVVAVVRDAINAEIAGVVSDRQATDKSWAEKLWTCPPETRLGVRELAEAVGRPPSWVYRHASPKGDLAPIPHRRLDGLLVFTAGEVRDWLRANEEPQ